MSKQNLPSSLVLETEPSGRRIEVDDPQQAAGLFLKLSSTREHDDADEGAFDTTGKALSRIGGNDEYSSSTQLGIIEWLAAHEAPGNKRVMLIGDSIRMRKMIGTGYGVHVYRNMLGEANFIHIPHNCGGSVHVGAYLENWLTAKPNVVFINCGLHDLSFRLGSKEPLPAYTTPDEYAQNLHEITKMIKASGVETMLWGLNTPVHETWHTTTPDGSRPRRTGRLNSTIRQYNDISLEVMKQHSVKCYDLFTPLWDAGVENVLAPDGVHLNWRGARLAASVVMEAVRDAL